MARIIGVCKSIINRELKCNTGKRDYRSKQAHKFATERKTSCITDFGWAYFEVLLVGKYSPEQITGRLCYLGWKDAPSHERICLLVTLVDKATRETKIKALPNSKADKVTKACIDFPSIEVPQSITFDNGKEFAQYQKISTKVFFAKPIHGSEASTRTRTV